MVVVPALRGERITLRPMKRDDMPAFSRWTTDIEVMGPVTKGKLFTLKEEYAWFDDISKKTGECQWTIVLNDAERIIGSCGLSDAYNSSGPEFGILIGDKNEWGKRYGGEAIGLIAGYATDVLKAPRLHLKVYTSNEKAIRAYKRAGFIINEHITDPSYNNEEQYVMELPLK